MAFANVATRCALLSAVRIMSIVSAVCVLAFAVPAVAAPPAIGNLSLRGLQIGATTTLAIDGANLLPRPRLLLSAPIVKQTLRAGATPTHIEIEVTIDDSIAAGIAQLRLATAGGVSAPVAVGLDTLPQRAMGMEPPTAPVPAGSIPEALSGSLAGGQTANTVVTLKRGQPIVVEVEAQRLGSVLDPVIHVYDHRGVPLAWAEGTTPLHGDARLTFVAPADGPYRVELHDAVFQAGNPGFFRLKIGQWYYAGVVFPPVVERGSQATLEFADTNLPAGTSVELNMPADAADMPAPWPAGVPLSGFRPVVLASDVPEIIQSRPADGLKRAERAQIGKASQIEPAPDGSRAAKGAMQQIVAPAGISGRLTPAKEDVYRVAVEPNERLRFEVLAARIGSPVDCVLAIRDEHGGQLASDDDQPGTVDPGLDFTVPANTHTVVVALKDVAGRGGPDCVYHLAISRINQEGFALALADDRLEIPAGGLGLLRVVARRTEYSGPIELSFHGLPPGVGVNDTLIDAGSDEALVSLPAAVGPSAAGIVTITGTATESPKRMVRNADLPAAGATVWQPWLRSEMAIARTAPPSIGLAWAASTAAAADDPVGAAVKPGETVPLAVTCSRDRGKDAASKGSVRLTLVSTQPMPERRIRYRLKNRRFVQKEVADPKRALRLDGAPMIPPLQNNTTVRLIIPGDLRASEYQLAIRADLLGADGNTVMATTYTPVLHLTVAPPPPKAAPAKPLAQSPTRKSSKPAAPAKAAPPSSTEAKSPPTAPKKPDPPAKKQ